MNQWPFIIAAYGLTVAGTIGMTVWSFAMMRSQERKAASLKDREAE